MANQQGGGGGTLVAFLAGAVIGAAIALLYAPATGDETREFLGQRAREGKDRATEAARQGRDMVHKQKENLSTAFDRAREEFRAVTRAEQEQDA